MAVAHDFASESHTGTTGSASEASFSWSHNPVGTPKGVLVLVFQLGNSGDDTTSVTYDGTTVPAVSGGNAVDTVQEPGRCKAFFLGSSVPTTDPATVVVNRNNNANVMYAVCVTVTASGDTAVTGVALEQENQALTEENVDDGSPGTNSLRYAGTFFGGANVPAAGSNSTALHDLDVGAHTAAVVRETTAGQGSRPVGFNTGATSDDVAAVYLAIKESGAAHTANPDDDEGLTDSASQVTTSVRSEDDAEGLTDTATRAADSVRTQTDPLGMVDDITADLTSGEHTREVTDNLGLGDSTPQVADSVRSQTDPLGLLDTAAQAADFTRSPTDPLGLLDDGTWTAVGPDPLGLTDGVLVEQVHNRTATDPLGLVDDVTADLTSGGTAHTATITDALGMVDAATSALGIVVEVTDPLGLVDTVAPSQGFTVLVTDPLGMVDATSTVQGFGVSVTDSLGLLDSVSGVADANRTIGDLLGLTDAITTQITGSTFWTPNPVAYTRNPAAYTRNPAAYVPVGPDDTPPW